MPVCNEGCPAGNDVRGFVQAVASGDYDKALAYILATSPFPGVCGRVCPSPCMAACNRHEHDAAVNIREIERYVAEHASCPVALRPARDERVAVVGSGPAGLSAAYHLAKVGYSVTVFEAAHELGGVLRTGIPSYRLPRDVLDDEIGFILSHGVEVRTDQPIDHDALSRIANDSSALFIATGLQRSSCLDVTGEDDGTVVQALQFLNAARRGQVDLTGQHVVVVGGGNTALDAARTALRLGAREVRVAYRRSRAQMPAIREEIEEGLEEGIFLDELLAPLRLYRTARGPVLVFQQMKLGEADESGRPVPVPVGGEHGFLELDCDRVLLALGQTRDESILPIKSVIREGSVLDGLGEVPAFVGGDFASNAGTVAAAIGSGRAAAARIHAALTGGSLFPDITTPAAGTEVLVLHRFPHVPQRIAPLMPAMVRQGTFSEVRLGFTQEPGRDVAREEAGRCFSCGACSGCGECAAYCPEGVAQPIGDNTFAFDLDYCKGCGLCASQCPRGAVAMSEV